MPILTRPKWLSHEAAKRFERYLAVKPAAERDSNYVDSKEWLNQFKETQKFHGKEGKNAAIRFEQSFDVKDNKKFSNKQYNEIGKELCERLFKGHEYIVVTHNDTGIIHNHIVVNPVNLETGNRIGNKMKHYHKWREENDKLSKERGLSIPTRTDHERSSRMPNEPRRIKQRNGFSYMLHVKDMADQARAISTSFDGYVRNMDQLGIQVRVEDKNVSYFYRDGMKGKRGSKLGKIYDKEGLIDAFKANDRKFLSDPGLKQTLLEGFRNSAQSNGAISKGSSAGLVEKAYQSWLDKKDYSAYTKIDRRSAWKAPNPVRGFESDAFVTAALKKAGASSIESYCRSKKIGLLEKNGKTVLLGKEIVSVNGSSWLNDKNKTSGNAIEFVRIHKGGSSIEAAYELTGDKKVKELIKYAPKNREYTPFYFPRQTSKDEQFRRRQVSQFLRSIGATKVDSEKFSKHKQVQIAKDGSIRFLSEDDKDGYWEFIDKQDGNYRPRPRGKMNGAFYSKQGSGSKAIIFSDIRLFLSSNGSSPMFKRKDRISIYVPMQKKIENLSELFRNDSISEVTLVTSGKDGLKPSEDLFALKLKKRFEGKEVTFLSLTPIEFERSQSREREGLGR